MVSINSLLLAWNEFLKGKKKRADVQEFQFNLVHHILALHEDLINGNYHHGPYQEFKINDPKPRVIHKATVRDRLVHHAMHRALYPFFDDTFFAETYSSRKDKGVHKALRRFEKFGRMVSQNNSRTCWVLKCDIKKFFHSIDHAILLEILRKYIPDEKFLGALKEIINSFRSIAGSDLAIGLPLGNLTSQLFCNIYMNEFDQFVKHRLKIKYYIRYADDFVVFSQDRAYLENLIPKFQEFLRVRLSLTLHPDKVFIKTLASGVDFLGWVHFFNYRVLRTVTKKRMFKKVSEKNKASYLGMLSHGNGHKRQNELLNILSFGDTIE